MSGRLTAQAVYRWDGTVAISFPFDRHVVDELKHQIPAPYRVWDAEAKEWSITVGWAHVAISILRSAFGHVEIEEFSSHRAKPEPIRKSDPNYAALHLMPSAPPELVQAAYKTLARMNHPDLGGTTREMQAINSAFDAIRKQSVS